jgi:5'-nucleotidase
MIAPGVLTKRDVLSTLPFNNKVVKLQLTGAVIRSALEHGVGSIGVEAQPGRFPQVSGIRYEYDATRKPGERITSITVNGKPLDDKSKYTLETTSYVALDAGDGYDMFRNAPLLINPEQGPSETDILLKAIGSVPAISPRTDGRISRVGAGKNKSTCN